MAVLQFQRLRCRERCDVKTDLGCLSAIVFVLTWAIGDFYFWSHGMELASSVWWLVSMACIVVFPRVIVGKQSQP